MIPHSLAAPTSPERVDPGPRRVGPAPLPSRPRRWLAEALALGAIVAACGGGDDSGASGPNAPACGPGTTLKNGACAPACGAGTVFDAASGACVVAAGGSGGTGGGAGASPGGMGGNPGGASGSAAGSAGTGGAALAGGASGGAGAAQGGTSTGGAGASGGAAGGTAGKAGATGGGAAGAPAAGAGGGGGYPPANPTSCPSAAAEVACTMLDTVCDYGPSRCVCRPDGGGSSLKFRCGTCPSTKPLETDACPAGLPLGKCIYGKSQCSCVNDDFPNPQHMSCSDCPASAPMSGTSCKGTSTGVPGPAGMTCTYGAQVCRCSSANPLALAWECWTCPADPAPDTACALVGAECAYGPTRCGCTSAAGGATWSCK